MAQCVVCEVYSAAVYLQSARWPIAPITLHNFIIFNNISNILRYFCEKPSHNNRKGCSAVGRTRNCKHEARHIIPNTMAQCVVFEVYSAAVCLQSARHATANKKPAI